MTSYFIVGTCTFVIFLDMMQQGIDLQVKPHIVISTPGRLADHLQSCDTFSLRKIKFLVSLSTITFLSNFIQFNNIFRANVHIF